MPPEFFFLKGIWIYELIRPQIVQIKCLALDLFYSWSPDVGFFHIREPPTKKLGEKNIYIQFISINKLLCQLSMKKAQMSYIFVGPIINSYFPRSQICLFFKHQVSLSAEKLFPFPFLFLSCPKLTNFNKLWILMSNLILFDVFSFEKSGKF